MRVAVVGVAWEAADHTRRWLRSVRERSAGHDVELHLLDNGSRDPAVAEAFREAGPRVHVRWEANAGLHRAWNRLLPGALDSGADLVALSNNDVVVGPGWLDALERELARGGDRYFLPSDPRCGPDGLAEAAAARATDLTTVPARAGWCLCLPPRAAALACPFPEAMELWCGDDWLHDVALAGWRCEEVRACVAHHAVSASCGMRPDLPKVAARDRAAYARVLAGDSRATLAECEALLLSLPRREDKRPRWLRAMPGAEDPKSPYYRLLYELAARLRPATFLEVGTQAGTSACHVAAASPGTRVVTLDVDVRSAEGVAALARERALRNLEAVHADSTRREGLEAALRLGRLSLLFVDGDHSYEALRSDLATFAPLLEPGGLALVDDVELLDGTRAAWAEFKAAHLGAALDLPAAHTYGGFGVYRREP